MAKRKRGTVSESLDRLEGALAENERLRNENFALRRAQLGLRFLAEESFNRVFSQSTTIALEKMAEGFAQELLNDPDFRESMKAEARRAAHNITEALKT